VPTLWCTRSLVLSPPTIWRRRRVGGPERHGSTAHDIRVFEEDAAGPWSCTWRWRKSLPPGRGAPSGFGLESDLQAAVPGLANVITHIEPSGERAAACNADPAEVEGIAPPCCTSRIGSAGNPAHDLCVRRTGHELAISFHCTLGAATSIKDAHAFTERIEQYLPRQIPTGGV